MTNFNKATAAALSGAFVTILVALAPMLGIADLFGGEAGGELRSAMQTVVMTAFVFFVPNGDAS